MRRSLSILLASLAFAAPALAQQKADDHAAHRQPPASTTAAADMTDGEVRRVDREGGRLTLRHGEIGNLGMPPMTMVFKVTETAWLGSLHPGDKVQFKAAIEGGSLTVTEIRVAR